MPGGQIWRRWIYFHSYLHLVRCRYISGWHHIRGGLQLLPLYLGSQWSEYGSYHISGQPARWLPNLRFAVAGVDTIDHRHFVGGLQLCRAYPRPQYLPHSLPHSLSHSLPDPTPYYLNPHYSTHVPAYQKPL